MKLFYLKYIPAVTTALVFLFTASLSAACFQSACGMTESKHSVSCSEHTDHEYSANTPCCCLSEEPCSESTKPALLSGSTASFDKKTVEQKLHSDAFNSVAPSLPEIKNLSPHKQPDSFFTAFQYIYILKCSLLV